MSATQNASAPVIDVRGLVKRYGDAVAVSGIDLQVMPGEIFGILGPNGAGKTTTLEMIEGLRVPDAGSIHVAGVDAIANSDAVRKLIGVQLQSTALFDYLSAAEIIGLFAGLYGVDGSPDRIDQLLAMVGLTEKRGARVDELSGGQRQRLSITLALVNDPVVTFLDEPTTGLDPAARRELWQAIRDVRAAGTTIVLTTHYMEEAEVLCDRVAVMDRGRLIALDTPRNLIRGLNAAARVRARVVTGTIDPGTLTAIPGVTRVVGGSHDNESLIDLQTADVQATLIGLLNLAARNGATLTDLASTQASLEDVFLNVTGRHYDSGEKPVAAETNGRGRRRR